MANLVKRNPSQEPVDTPDLENDDTNLSVMRRNLALVVTLLLVVVALVAAFQIGAMPVLDKLLPLIAVVFTFFFGQKANKK